MNIFIEIVISICLSAFFSGMEIAFVSSDKLRFEMDKKEQSITSKIISIFYRDPNHFISTMLIGNNISLVIYGILMANLIADYLFTSYAVSGFALLSIQTIISTLIIIVTGEFLPKSIFKIDSNLSLKIFAVPAYIFYILLFPISKFTSSLSRNILKLFGTKINKEASIKAFSKIDLDYLVQSSIDNTDNQKELDSEIKIFRNALDFSNIKIRDCMIPRTEIVCVEENTDVDILKEKFIESGISKIIVYKQNIDNVVGFIHCSEMFSGEKQWQKKIKKLPIIPETMIANKLMKLFMQQKRSIAIVVDEFGGTSGIVTLEDLVEEIFGEIEDEHDNNSNIAKRIGENEYILSGRTEIENINEEFSINLPESEDYQTIGGLILNKYQSFPKIHEVITIDKFQFTIIKVTSTKIELVKLTVTE